MEVLYKVFSFLFYNAFYNVIFILKIMDWR